MTSTDSTRVFGGKRYRYLTWVLRKSSVDWFKRKAKADGMLLRVTEQTKSGFPTGGYNLWTRKAGT